MKGLVLFAAALSSAQTILNAHSPSFLDQLYGELVHDAPNISHNRYLYQQQQLQPQTDEMDLVFSTNDQKQPDSYYAHIFNYHMKMRATIDLPDKDDVSDILVDQNMFGGIVTYAHLPHFHCIAKPSRDTKNKIDVAIIGAPFDTGVSFRPGARFGPDSIRSAAKRLGSAWNSPKKRPGYPVDPYDPSTHNYSIVDCGDVAMTPFDNRIALNQLYRGLRAISENYKNTGSVYAHPRVITLGGDHTITLMCLKNLYEQHGRKIKVLHFDSHIDTWDPKVLGGGITNYMSLNHGTFLHYAHELGLIQEGHGSNYHVGIRAPLIDTKYDSHHDSYCGFQIIGAADIDRIGVRGIVERLKQSYTEEDIKNDTPVYISVDIDVLDPAYAPGTGTMEVGGFTTRELLSILDGLKGSELGNHLVGCDVVEVSPPFDSNSGITSLAATAVIDSFLKIMVR
ncbi:uncharacterized protein LODBEIA_P35720 [Lodderomyces beijingensis]|uniref:Agmatinase n=1 Tax=Lodderomyces beijingensis TaxID=1775926 RepID=A0ABP0ZNT5_9ASCO